MAAKRVTSIDVARLAGVSQSTVSRTFNPKERVSPEARKKVRAAALELGYRPSAIARSLTTRRTNIVGIVMAGINNAFYPYALDMFTKRLQEMDRQVLSLEDRVVFLATTANVCPFIGLLGTVWGVLSTFYRMGAETSATLDVVGPGLAGALVTTIAGLVAAIPAVVAYNHFSGAIGREIVKADGFCARILSVLERNVEERNAKTQASWR